MLEGYFDKALVVDQSQRFGTCEELGKQLHAAIEVWEQKEVVQPDHFNCLRDLAQNHPMMRDYSVVIEAHCRVLRSQTDDAKACRNLGSFLQSTKQYKRAFDIWLRSLGMGSAC